MKFDIAPEHKLLDPTLYPVSTTTPTLWDAQAKATAATRPATIRPALVIIGCSAAKADTRQMAEDLYTSSLFNMALRAGRRLCPARIGIISALHGLINPETVIAPYDCRLGDTDAITPEQFAATAHTFINGTPIEGEIIALTTSAYTQLASTHWSNITTPLANPGGIGGIRHRLKTIADTGELPEAGRR